MGGKCVALEYFPVSAAEEISRNYSMVPSSYLYLLLFDPIFLETQNATVAEYGLIDYDADDKEGTVHKIMSEIYSRGPVAATINAEPIVKYTGGVFSEEGKS